MPDLTVIQVIPHNRPGGMQLVARQLDTGLPAHGISSSILDLERWTAGSGRRAMRRLRGWFRLISAFRRQSPDGVLAHTVLNALYSLTAARLAGVPHGWLVVHGTRDGMGRLRVALIDLLCRTGLATGVICCGHAVRDSYRELGGAVQRRMHVVQNGVRLPESIPTTVPTEPAPGLALVTACRLDPEKDLPTAIEACALAHSPIHLTICGQGRSRTELETLARQLNAPVQFAGNLGRNELAGLFAACDVFLFTTRHEGMPLVLIEAAAAGLPVIASDLAANREVMGGAAHYCPVGDAAAFAAAIDLLAATPEYGDRMRAAGQRQVAEFTVERMVAGYAALLGRG